MATVATYSLLGASDISVASGASMRASYSTKKGAKIFVESSLPIYGLEYTDSCVQASEGGEWKQRVHWSMVYCCSTKTIITHLSC